MREDSSLDDSAALAPFPFRLILASSSPRRRDILAAHGLDFEVWPPAVEESLDASLPLAGLPLALEALAMDKARSVARQLPRADEAIVVAADTVVFCDGLLGKPRDHGHAVEMLLALRGRAHFVLTAVALIKLPGGWEAGFTDQAEVRFGDYSLAEIEAYIEAEPPYDKAGAYAIQGLWGQHVVGLSGDIETVIGLPFARLAEALAGLLR